MQLHLVDQIFDGVGRLIHNHVLEQVVKDLVEPVVPIIAGDERVRSAREEGLSVVYSHDRGSELQGGREIERRWNESF